MGRILMIFLMIAGLEVQSAEFKVIDNSIEMEGAIEKGDERKLYLMVKDNQGINNLIINSVGGSYNESKKMSRLIKAFDLNTEVRPNEEAISGGAIMLFSGRNIVVGMTASVALHAPYFRNKEDFNDSVKTWLEEEEEEADFFELTRDGAEMIANYLEIMSELTSVPPSIIIKSAIHVDGSLYNLSLADYDSFYNVTLNKRKK